MKDKLNEIKELLIENPIAFLLVFNVLLTSYFGVKLMTRTIDETVTRIVIDHNSKEDIRAMKKEVCFRGLKSILRKQADKKFVDMELANSLADANYTNFEVEDTESIHVDMRSDVVCTAMLKYEDRSMRSFNVDIISDRESAPLLFVIQDINESLVREST